MVPILRGWYSKLIYHNAIIRVSETSADKLARIVYHLVRCWLGYVRPTEAVYDEKMHQRLEKLLHRRARGYELRKITEPAEPSFGVAGSG